MAGSTKSEWLNRNAYRAFPFEENSDFSCKDGKTFPLCLVLDARACLLGTSKEKDVFLKSAYIVEDHAEVVLLYNGNSYVFSGGGSVLDGDVVIRVTMCGMDALNGLEGEYELLNPPKLLASRVLSIPYGIGIYDLKAGDTVSTGKIRVADGHNTELDIVDNSLRLKIVKGAGKGVICGDSKGDVCDGAILYYLDGQKADSDGSIWIKGDEGVSISSGTYKGIPAVFVKTSATIDSFIYR